MSDYLEVPLGLDEYYEEGTTLTAHVGIPTEHNRHDFLVFSQVTSITRLDGFWHVHHSWSQHKDTITMIESDKVAYFRILVHRPNPEEDA